MQVNSKTRAGNQASSLTFLRTFGSPGVSHNLMIWGGSWENRRWMKIYSKITSSQPSTCLLERRAMVPSPACHMGLNRFTLWTSQVPGPALCTRNHVNKNSRALVSLPASAPNVFSVLVLSTAFSLVPYTCIFRLPADFPQFLPSFLLSKDSCHSSSGDHAEEESSGPSQTQAGRDVFRDIKLCILWVSHTRKTMWYFSLWAWFILLHSMVPYL